MEERYNSIAAIETAASWAVPTVRKLLEREILRGADGGLDLSWDMLRLLVMNDSAGLYD